MENVINYIKEQQREYEHGSNAYNVLRKLEIVLPHLIKQSLEVSYEEEESLWSNYCASIDGKEFLSKNGFINLMKVLSNKK